MATPLLREFAVDPAVVRSWRDLKDLRDAFGFEQGRLISELPKDWRRLVHAAMDRAEIKEVERLRADEMLKQIDARKFAPRPDRRWLSQNDWITNARDEMRRDPFDGIVRLLTPGETALEGDISWEDAGADERWRVPPGTLVEREPKELERLLGLLLRVSSELHLIDPYLKLDLSRYKSALKTYLPLLGTRRPQSTRTLHLHALQKNVPDFIDRCTRELPSLLPATITAHAYLWAEKAGGRVFHNRYIVTDVGGYKFGHATDAPGNAHDDHVDRLSESVRVELLERVNVRGTTYALTTDNPVKIAGVSGASRAIPKPYRR